MQQLSLTVKCVTWIGWCNEGRSVTNESNASRFQRADRGDPTVTQIHFKRFALGKLMDRRWLRWEPMLCHYAGRVSKYHVDLVGQITSFCPCAYVSCSLCVMERQSDTEETLERKRLEGVKLTEELTSQFWRLNQDNVFIFLLFFYFNLLPLIFMLILQKVK